MATQKELAADVANVSTQLGKIGTESSKSLEKITELEGVIANMGQDATPELIDAVAALKAQVQAVDDLVPDVAVPPADGGGGTGGGVTPPADGGTGGATPV